MTSMFGRIGESVFGDKCTNRGKTIKNNPAYIKVQEQVTKASKITFLLDYYPQSGYQKNMEKLANLYMKTRDECGYNVDLEAINLVVAHKNARAEIKKFGSEQGGNIPNGRYPKFSNNHLASEDFIIRKIQEKQPTAGGKKRKYKRKTNKRKTNKRKTNKRKTNKKRTKK